MTTKVSSHSVWVTLGVVNLQLLVDVGLVHQRVENVEDRVNIPNLGIALQSLNLLIRLLAQLGPELGEGLELVDELVNDLPEPLVGQLKVHGLLSGEDVVEQLAVVVVGVKSEEIKLLS